MKGNLKYDGILRAIELNRGHIDIYKNSVMFHDDEAEECWEYDWKDLYELTKGDYDFIKD